MWNSKTKMLLGLAFILPLYGCGGGGGGGGEGGSSGSTGSGSTGSSTPASSGTPVSLSSLQIDPANSLTSVYKVDVDVSLPHLASSQVYISICDNAGGNLQSVDYNKCMVKAALQSGTGSYQLQVPNHCESLIAVVSVMEPNTQPLVYTLNHNNQPQTQWLIQ
ncbi:hypothetical protein OPW33_19200 [Vibrio europaeus]|uniref:hypothetical protein n=1 Tax=Vibrio europaeus TaxID=300876 RepID=UPI00233F5DAE|nr:hypothetical protein [Vibrio europaeus]MDC5822792.1 hypothetical protein [Vibrio europaeus]MDC5841458.1 hypothetical protein [Vibrio europaeus]MDC5869426.1 hypothetical protein [Vibrio europaeus]